MRHPRIPTAILQALLIGTAQPGRPTRTLRFDFSADDGKAGSVMLTQAARRW